MIYIFRRASSTGARQLAESLPFGRRLKSADRIVRVRPTDQVICWGDHANFPAGTSTLNNKPLTSKLTDAETLRRAGVPTIEVSRQAPPQQAVGPAVDASRRSAIQRANILAGVISNEDWVRISAIHDELQQALRQLQGALAAPPPDLWLPRSNHHIGGNDLLLRPPVPDFWVKKENITREFRVHSFLGKSLRAGAKVKREDVAQPHAWIRSWDGGWRIDYGQGNDLIRNVHRDLAHRAITALGLDFGAVDIGEKADGSLLVFEVNRAPGIEAGTLEAYTKAIQQWANGGGQ